MTLKLPKFSMSNFPSMPNYHTTPTNHLISIRLLQRSVQLAQEGWDCEHDTLRRIVAEIKSIDFTQEGAGISFQNAINDIFPEQGSTDESAGSTDESDGSTDDGSADEESEGE